MINIFRVEVLFLAFFLSLGGSECPGTNCHRIPGLVPTLVFLSSCASLNTVEWYILKSMRDVEHPSLRPLLGVQLELLLSLPFILYSVCSWKPSSALFILLFIPIFVRIGNLTLGYAFVTFRSVATEYSGCFMLMFTPLCVSSWILMNICCPYTFPEALLGVVHEVHFFRPFFSTLLLVFLPRFSTPSLANRLHDSC